VSQKSERLFQALTDISERTIDEAAQPVAVQKTIRWKRWTALAAAMALVIGLGGYLLPRMGGSSAPGAGAGGSGTSGASTFMSYAGPVFPLTLAEETDAIEATRNVTLDFQPWVKTWQSNEEEAASRTDLSAEERQDVLNTYNEWFPEGGRWESSTDIQVTDTYLMTNYTPQEQNVTVLYPFTGSLYGDGASIPTLMLDGEELDTSLHIGDYVGGFQGAWGEVYQQTGENPGTLNLKQPDSWEDYRDALDSGAYMEYARSADVDLSNIPVVVYKFTDPWGPAEDDKKGVPNPSVRVTFELDYDKTTVLSYGFHSGSYDPENGTMGRGFSIPQEWQPDYGEPYYLIVVGEDVKNMSHQIHVTGGWDDDPTAEGGVTITRFETDLTSALHEAAWPMYESYRERVEESGCLDVDYETWFELLCRYLTAYGPLAGEGAERYDGGMLESLDFENVERVFYLEAEVAVPSDKPISLTASMAKAASFDFHCANTENRGISGYDMVTELGSNLACKEQTATLLDHGQIKIIRQNFGFDLENGMNTVSLDPAVEHYYLEVKRAADSEKDK